MTKHTHHRNRTHQEGVVLIVALLLLMVLTILASISIRGASSSEQIANQDRLKVTGQQAAEAALRFCEGLVQAYTFDPLKNTVALGGLIPDVAPGGGAPFNWEINAGQNFWDNAPGPIAPQIVPFAAAGDGVGGNLQYFQRPPECMSQYTAAGNNKVVVTTARGFGPEVPALVAAKNGSAPVGTEVWLQSVITMN